MEQAAQRQAAALAAEQEELARHTLTKWPPADHGTSQPLHSSPTSSHTSEEEEEEEEEEEVEEYDEDDEEEEDNFVNELVPLPPPPQQQNVAAAKRIHGGGDELPFLRAQYENMHQMHHLMPQNDITINSSLAASHTQNLHSITLTDKCTLSDLMDLNSCNGIPIETVPCTVTQYTDRSSLSLLNLKQTMLLPTLRADQNLEVQCSLPDEISVNTYKNNLSSPMNPNFEQMSTINSLDMDSLRQTSNPETEGEFLPVQNSAVGCPDALSLVMEQTLTKIMEDESNNIQLSNTQDLHPGLPLNKLNSLVMSSQSSINLSANNKQLLTSHVNNTHLPVSKVLGSKNSSSVYVLSGINHENNVNVASSIQNSSSQSNAYTNRHTSKHSIPCMQTTPSIMQYAAYEMKSSTDSSKSLHEKQSQKVSNMQQPIQLNNEQSHNLVLPPPQTRLDQFHQAQCQPLQIFAQQVQQNTSGNNLSSTIEESVNSTQNAQHAEQSHPHQLQQIHLQEERRSHQLSQNVNRQIHQLQNHDLHRSQVPVRTKSVSIEHEQSQFMHLPSNHHIKCSSTNQEQKLQVQQLQPTLTHQSSHIQASTRQIIQQNQIHQSQQIETLQNYQPQHIQSNQIIHNQVNQTADQLIIKQPQGNAASQPQRNALQQSLSRIQQLEVETNRSGLNQIIHSERIAPNQPRKIVASQLLPEDISQRVQHQTNRTEQIKPNVIKKMQTNNSQLIETNHHKLNQRLHARQTDDENHPHQLQATIDPKGQILQSRNSLISNFPESESKTVPKSVCSRKHKRQLHQMPTMPTNSLSQRDISITSSSLPLVDDPLSQKSLLLNEISRKTAAKLETQRSNDSKSEPPIENSSRYRHVRKVHQCDVCNKEFRRQNHLKVHKLTHTGERPYPCDNCPATFANQFCLRRHMKSIHSTETSHKCTICDASFSNASRLKLHKDQHSKPFLCGVCGRGFALKQTRDNHVLGHTGLRPYACTMCDKTFLAQNKLRSHMKGHTGEIVCLDCLKTFSSQVCVNLCSSYEHLHTFDVIELFLVPLDW